MGIELTRGIAALMVLLTHYAAFFTGGDTGLAFLWTGVDLFFVISGYVFARLVYGGRLDVKPYLIRRFFRIYPLYLLAVCSYYFFSAEHGDKVEYFLRHLAFLHTTRSTEEAFFFNPAFWSLPVEIEYYLALPLLVLLGRSPKSLPLLFSLSLLLSLYLNYNRGTEVDAFRIFSVHLSGILPEFFMGTFLYAAVNNQANHKREYQLLSLGLGMLLIGFLYLSRYGNLGLDLEDSAVIRSFFNTGCALGYALLLFPLLCIDDKAYPPLLQKTAFFCGAISYGVYLFHNLMPRILQDLGMMPKGLPFVALATGLTVTLAFVLYLVWENPWRLYGRRLSRTIQERRNRRSSLIME